MLKKRKKLIYDTGMIVIIFLYVIFSVILWLLYTADDSTFLLLLFSSARSVSGITKKLKTTAITLLRALERAVSVF